MNAERREVFSGTLPHTVLDASNTTTLIPAVRAYLPAGLRSREPRRTVRAHITDINMICWGSSIGAMGQAVWRCTASGPYLAVHVAQRKMQA